MAKKNSDNGSSRINPRPVAKPAIRRRDGSTIESRTIDPKDAAYFATQNPDMFDDAADGPSSTSKASAISRVNGRNKTELASKHSKINQPKKGTKKAGVQIDAGLYDSVFSEQDQELQYGSDDISPSDNSELAKAKAKYGKNQGVQFLDENQEYYGSSSPETEENFVSSVPAQLVFKAADKKMVQLKKLELEVLGFQSEIEEDFGEEYLLYRSSTEIIPFEDKDESFKKVGSGVYIQNDNDVWYLNTEDGVKYLVKVGLLSEISLTEKPENYDFIKSHIPAPESYQLSGPDLHLLFNHQVMLDELGIQIVDKAKNLVSLTKFSKQEIQQIFINYGVSALISEIYMPG